MGNSIQVDLGRIAQDLQIRRSQVESVVQLLDDGNTVPFITRYRKEATGNLNEVVIGEIHLRVQRLRELAERKETILKSIEGQGKLTPDLAAAIRAADHPKRLEDLYLPFKPKKRSKASEAREKGLEPLAFRIWTRDETLTDLTAAAQEFINPEKGLDTSEKVLEGVGHILAEAISEMAAVRDAIRRLLWKTGKIVTAKAEVPEGQGLEYRDYFDYSEPIAQIPPHRILAINRGDKEGPLKVRLDLPRKELEHALFAQLPLDGHPHAQLFSAAAIDALDRLVLPSMEREVRRDLTEGAEKHAIDVFAKNLRSLLLQPPIPKQVVMAIDPGFRTGCKVAVLDRGGTLLDQGVIYPHPPQNRRSDAKVFLKDLVGKHQVGVVAIGNGTACRETEELVAEVIAEGTFFSQNPEAAAAALEAAAKAPEAARSPEPEPQPTPEAQPEPPLDSADGPNNQSLEPAESHAEGAQPDAQIDSPAGSHADDATGNSHPTSDPHPPTVAETPIGALPPISGGAPDSSVPEAEIESAGGSSSSEAVPPTAALADAERAHSSPSGTESADAHAVQTNHDQIPVEAEKSSLAAAEAQESPFAVPPAAEPEPSQGPPDASPDPAPTGAVARADFGKSETAGATPPLRGSRGSGRGKPDPSRSRSQRPRNTPNAPPPPPEPPRPHPSDAIVAQLAYVVVNEAGASVYSTSQVGREELPDSDATLRSGISIGRRLQDPLSELVKIEPQNIGVGLYQHDINPKHLKDTLETVISSCVNFVGVDLNTASVPLLRHVSGLNQLTARRIVDFRKEHGPFTGREQLQQVEGVGPATYTQAAGFLKIQDGGQPLDRTWIHPESYGIATRLLETLGYAPDVVRDKDRLAELRGKLAEVDTTLLSRELEIGELTLRDIIDSLGRPERDPRDDLPKPIFKKGILKIEDLAAGMELKGTVLNVVDFGAFVDIGLKDSGLVHISQLANRYVKSPHDMVSVGDIVTVWVMGVDHERKRVSLTMVKPGTERNRGPQSGGRRGGPEGENREGQSGQGRRGGQRSPRPIASALTAPPVGAPSVAVLPETPPRRQDRDRPPGPGGPRAAEARPPGQSQQESRGPHPRQGGPGSGPPPGRGGPRGPLPGPNAGRPPRLDRGPADRSQNRPPRRPAAPPPPLSKEALEGNVPLRTFGQLKQLWEARTDEPGDATPDSAGSAPTADIAQPTEPSAPFVDNPQSDASPAPVLSEPDNQTHSS